MNLRLLRYRFTETSTMGLLLIDGVFECYTLEDRVRPDGEKVYGFTAIPYGHYDVVINHSPRFQQLMPLILDVPGFSGVRFHWGNKASDTDGCVLVGDTASPDFVGASKIAYERLYKKLRASKDGITLDIIKV